MKAWGRSRSKGEDGALDLVLDSRPSGFSFVIFLFCHSNKYVVFVRLCVVCQNLSSDFTGKGLEYLLKI